MRGQTALRELRLAGYTADMVWVSVLETECPTSFWNDAENMIDLTGRPEIHIGVDDNISALDLRVLHGTTTLISALSVDKAREVYRRARQFRPKRIIAAGPDFLYDSGGING